MKKKELLQLIRDLENRVAMLEIQLQGKQDRTIYVPSIWPSVIGGCSAGGACEYPSIWNGTMPAPCNKCGKTPSLTNPPYVITSITTSTDIPSNCPTCVDNKCQCKL